MLDSRKKRGKDAMIVRYPKLRMNYDLTRIVLFTDRSTGTVVWTNISGHDKKSLGTSHSNWESRSFRDFSGSVEMSNKYEIEDGDGE